ncbi:MAG TPA: hypothetical protein VGI97_00660 [Gemmatimonadaceae bacterium]|jgi:hypothetical protein
MGFFDSFTDVLGTIVAPVPFLANKLSGGALANMLGLGGGDIPAQQLIAPPLPADATDEEIRKAVLMQRRRLLVGQGQGSTFISGSMGDPSPFSTSKSGAGGF